MNDVFETDDVYAQVDKGEVKVKVVKKNTELETWLEVSDFDKRLIEEGGVSNYLRKKLKWQTGEAGSVLHTKCERLNFREE